MCVLIVEDEPLIRLIAAEEFLDAGFEVREAESGDLAAKLIDERQVEFTLLVTDIHMPGTLNGMQVAQIMRERHPSVPVIYTTGRPDVFDKLSLPGSRDVLLSKPYLPSVLLRTGRALLRAEGANTHEG